MSLVRPAVSRSGWRLLSRHQEWLIGRRLNAGIADRTAPVGGSPTEQSLSHVHPCELCLRWLPNPDVTCHRNWLVGLGGGVPNLPEVGFDHGKSYLKLLNFLDDIPFTGFPPSINVVCSFLWAGEDGVSDQRAEVVRNSTGAGILSLVMRNSRLCYFTDVLANRGIEIVLDLVVGSVRQRISDVGPPVTKKSVLLAHNQFFRYLPCFALIWASFSSIYIRKLGIPKRNWAHSLEWHLLLKIDLLDREASPHWLLHITHLRVLNHGLLNIVAGLVHKRVVLVWSFHCQLNITFLISGST